MSTTDDTAATGTGTSFSLSADAAEFVPKKFTQTHDTSVEQGGGGDGGGGKQLTEVPAYITNCYPFVNPNTAPRPRHPSKQYGGGGSRPFMVQDQSAYLGGSIRYSVPQPMRFPHHQHWVSSPQPAHVPQPLVMRPLSAGVGLPFDGGTPSVGAGLLPTPPLGDGLLPTPPYPPINMPSVLGAGSRGLMAKNVPYMAGLPMTSSQIVTPHDGKKGGITSGARRGRGSKVSTGTQKETARATHGQPWGRTLIMKDNSVQTDFHPDIADLTLCEKASVLYRRGQRKNKASQPQVSTDSEEVDSDSGYSSPLHRRNLVSNGTHPVRINAILEAADHNRRSAASVGAMVGAAGNGGVRSGNVMLAKTSRGSGDNGPKLQKGGSDKQKDSSSDKFFSPADARLASAGKKNVSEGDKKTLAQKDGNDNHLNVPSAMKNQKNVDKSGKSVQDVQSAMSGKSGVKSGMMGKDASGMQSRVGESVPTRSAPNQDVDKMPGARASQKAGDSTASGTQKELPAPDFPVLRPAKRNEPPWSLTPQRSKVSDGGGGSSGVMSYASIVKSATSVSRSPNSPSVNAGIDVGSQHNVESSKTENCVGQNKGSSNTKQRCDTFSVHPGNPGGAETGQLSQQSPSQSTSTPTTPNGPTWSRVAASHSAGNSGQKDQSNSRSAWNKVAAGKASSAQQRWADAAMPTATGSQMSQSQQNSRAGSLGRQSPARTVSRESSPGQHRHKSPAANSQNNLANDPHHRAKSPAQSRHRSQSNDGRQRRRSSGSQQGNASDTQRSQSNERRNNPSSQAGPVTDEDGKSEKEDEEQKGPRRRRRRRRRRKHKTSEEGLSDGLSGMERTVSSSNISRTSDVTLHFDDELEFPDISASNALPIMDRASNMTRVDSVSSLSYSDILKRKPGVNDVRSRTQSAPGSCLSGEEGGDENFNSQPGQGSVGQVTLSRRARKRRKRRELANRAAEAELAEISLEQQMLREFGQKVSGSGSRPGSASREDRSGSRSEKSPSRGLITIPAVVQQSRESGQGHTGRKAHQPIALNIADMLDAFEKKRTLDATVTVKKSPKDEGKKGHNILDASAPVKRGKEREMPKPKKPSPLKKVILKEREEKKRMRLIDDIDIYSGVDMADNPDDEMLEEILEANSGNPVGLGDSDLSQDALSSRSVDTDQGVSPGADLSPISQTSPLSMSPLTPGASPLNSPIAGCLSRDPVVLRIHSRRFREYCTQILDKDIDACCTSLLHELVRFQDRMYHKDPTKAKSKRRVVLGLREVTKHLKLKKIKCVIISPNLEKIQSKGGLDEALNNILTMCQEQNVPFVFALGRRALGRACAKLVPVSVAGIFNYEGCEEKFNQLISLTHKGREAYEEMKQAVEREIAENPPPPAMSTGSSMPNLFAHMGHSRTPSGCSAISFTSSVLSEPISENYPYAEPETDSKGYEIRPDAVSRPTGSPSDPVGRDPESGCSAYHPAGSLGGYQPRVDDIDDGNEADIEDLSDNPRRKKGQGGKKGDERAVLGEKGLSENADRGPSPKAEGSTSTQNDVTEPDIVIVTNAIDLGRKDSDEEQSESECDSQRELPHIDSIHSNMYDLSTEILSQHSSRTIDNSEVLSTHSSRTLGESTLPANSDRLRQDGQRTPELGQHIPENAGQLSPARLMNSDRIQNWVEKTQLCFQDMARGSNIGSGVSDDEDDDDEFVEAREDLQDSDTDTDTENVPQT